MSTKSATNGAKIKTTILLDKTLKKLAQVYAIQNDMGLGELIEEALSGVLLGDHEPNNGKNKA